MIDETTTPDTDTDNEPVMTREERRELTRRILHLAGPSLKKLARDMVKDDAGISFLEEEDDGDLAIMVLLAVGGDAIEHVQMGLALADNLAENMENMTEEELAALDLGDEDDDSEEDESQPGEE